MKKKYKSLHIEASLPYPRATEYLFWKCGGGQIGCMAQEASGVRLFPSIGLNATDLVHIAAIVQMIQVDYKKKGGNR